MTRINTLDPQELTDQHLFSEWRELPRVWGGAIQWLMRGRPGQIPPTYRLGAGHVRFFYSRLGWLGARHQLLTEHLLARGYALSVTTPLVAPAPLAGSWQPTEASLAESRQRLAAKLRARPGWYRFYGQVVSSEFYDRGLAA